MSEKKKLSYFSKQDIVLIVLLFFLGIVLTVIIYRPATTDAASEKQLEVRQNGTVIMTLPIKDEDTEQRIENTSDGYNVFTIKNGTVQMTAADCPDSTCVHTGSISRVGETIVCLPHRLVLKIVEIKDDSSPDTPDAIVY
jgi:hypothetical protein